MLHRISRRHFLQGAAALAASNAFAAPPRALRSGEVLPDPDFTQLRDKNPYTIGIRPHRKGGARVELDEKPYEGSAGIKRVIHNYGHGGGGITLSFGCASVVADHVQRLLEASKTLSVAVLGTGVIGLTTASELRRRWPELPITVYARDLDVRTTTSFMAGGQFEPSGIFREYEARKDVIATYLRRSRDRVVEIQQSGNRLQYGVAERKNYTFDHENRAFDVFVPRDVIPAYRAGALPFAKQQGPGREYSTWLINPSILLPKLVEELAASSVAFKERTFSSLQDVLSIPESLIINCTGLGAKTLFSDENVIPQRGHLVVLKKTDARQFYFFSGGCQNPVIFYVFCRQDDIVIGGTVQAGSDVVTQGPGDEAIFKKLLANARGVFAGQGAACVG